MVLVRKAAIIFALLTTALQAWAGDEVSRILAASAGGWKGEFHDLDYQYGNRFGSPMKM